MPAIIGTTNVWAPPVTERLIVLPPVLLGGTLWHLQRLSIGASSLFVCSMRCARIIPTNTLH